MHDTHFQSQFTAAALLEYLLHFLQKWSKTPWISEHTTHITIVCRAALAFFGTLGITFKYSSADHTLLIGGLSLIAILTFGWHMISQYAMQHAFGGLVRSGNTDAFKKVIVEAVLQVVNAKMASTLPAPAPVQHQGSE